MHGWSVQAGVQGSRKSPYPSGWCTCDARHAQPSLEREKRRPPWMWRMKAPGVEATSNLVLERPFHDGMMAMNPICSRVGEAVLTSLLVGRQVKSSVNCGVTPEKKNPAEAGFSRTYFSNRHPGLDPGHPGAGRGPTPDGGWIPAFAGMTGQYLHHAAHSTHSTHVSATTMSMRLFLRSLSHHGFSGDHQTCDGCCMLQG